MFKSRRNIGIFAGGVVVVVVAIALVLLSLQGQTTVSAAYSTTTVTQGTLTSSITGSGSVASALTSNLTWQSSGQVDKVNVQIGDQVKVGDVLATLSDSSSSVSTLLSNLTNDEQALADMTSPTAIAAAQKTVVADQAALATAQATLAGLNQHGQGAIDNAAAAVVLAQNNVTVTQKVLDGMADKPDTDPDKALFIHTLYIYQLALDRAQMNYDALTQPASTAATDSAKSAVAQAQVTLKQAQDYLTAITGGTVPADASGAALQNYNQAVLAIEKDKQALQNAEIVAPFDGTVTQANAVPGQVVGGNATAFRIDDLGNLVVTIQVVQADINKVKVGQAATITFDAVSGKTFNGEVSKVDLVAASGSSSTSYNVSIQLTDADAQVKPGMTANVTVITSNVTDALIIPSTAIFTDTNGQNYVYLVQNGTTTIVPVTVGTTSSSDSEITSSGLQAGDTIVSAFNSSSSTTTGRGLFGGLFGGMFGGGSARSVTVVNGGGPNGGVVVSGGGSVVITPPADGQPPVGNP